MSAKQSYRLRLYDAGGCLSKRWFVEVAYTKADGQIDRRRFFEGVNTQPDVLCRSRALGLLAAELETKLANGWVPGTRHHTFLRALAKVIQVKRVLLRKQTIINYELSLRRLDAWLTAKGWRDIAPDRFTPNTVRDFADHLDADPNLSATARNTYLRQLRALGGEAATRNWIPTNPFAGFKPARAEPKSHTPFTPDERSQIRAYLSKEDPGLWTFVQFVYYTYIRPGELVQLQMRHFNLAEGRVLVPSHISKNGMGLYVAIPPQLLEHLRESNWQRFPSDWHPFGPDLLPARTAIGRDAATKRHARMLRRLGLGGEGRTLYSWKHTGVVAAVQSGANVVDVQNHLRHQDLKTMQVYLRGLGQQTATQLAANFPVL